MPLDLRGAWQAVEAAAPWIEAGRVRRVAGGVVEASGPRLPVGTLCQIGEEAPTAAEVIGFREDALLLMPLSGVGGLRPGAPVTSGRAPLGVPTGPALLGRILDGLGTPIDGRGPLAGQRQPVVAQAPAPLERRRIREPLVTGVRAI